MKTIILFTRGYEKDEFIFWTAKSTMEVELRTEKGTDLIFSYKNENRRLYVVLSLENFWEQVIPYLKSNDFSNALILAHSIRKPEIISDIQGINCVLQKNYCTGNGDIHLPPPDLIDNSSKPLDKLLDSVQKKENAYDFSKAFDEVWNSFVKSELNAGLQFLHQCLSAKPSGLSLLIKAGININAVCNSEKAQGKTIEKLFCEFEVGNKVSLVALRDGILEQIGEEI